MLKNNLLGHWSRVFGSKFSDKNFDATKDTVKRGLNTKNMLTMNFNKKFQ